MPWRRTWVTSPIAFASALVLVLDDRRSTFFQWLSAPSRQSHVPVGVAEVLGRTAHQRPAWNQSFDWGFSPVVVESFTGASAVTCSCATAPGGADAEEHGREAQASHPDQS